MLTGTLTAYIGPGACFGIVTSFLNAIPVSLFSALIWPAAIVIMLLRRRRREFKRAAKRVVIPGLDGFSPDITERMMNDGE